jgi:hypothetical protein
VWTQKCAVQKASVDVNISYYLNNLIKKKLAAVSRNRYGVEKTVDTHKILINAIQFYVCLQEI